MHTSVRKKLILLFTMALILVVAFVFVLENKQKTTFVSEQQRAFPEFTFTELMDSGRGHIGTQVLTLADITPHPYQQDTVT